jgi:regulator of replication initiation timing
MDNDLMEKLKIENENLKKKLEETEQQLKKYTNGDNHKRYYMETGERPEKYRREYKIQ